MGATASDGFPSPSDGRVAFVGDTHGNSRWAADVLVCHDYPELGYRLPSMPGLEPHHQEASREVQLLLAGVARAVGCELAVHGHRHRRYTAEADGADVEGLDRDDSAFGAAIVDLGTLEAEDWLTPAPGTLRSVLA